MKRIFIFLPLLVTLAACSHSVEQKKVTGDAPIVTASTEYVSPLPTRGLDDDDVLSKIAFGSCFNQDQPAPLWQDIAQTKPDLFLFMGDNVYASSPAQQPIAEQYRKLDQVPAYRALRAEVPFMATWDDHDYGQQDGGADWSGKALARRDFLNYWLYVKNRIPPEQTGIYHAQILGPRKKTVQVIMLDARSYRSPLKALPSTDGKPAGYEQNQDGTVLGEAQWEWLETQLKRPAEVRFLVSSIQVIATEPPFEKWGNFPKERQRLFDLIAKTRAQNLILLSGDRHSGSISKTTLKSYGDLYEVTASSINRPHTHPDQDRHYINSSYNRENFGLAQIDWTRRLMKIEILGLGNQTVNSVEIKLRK